MLCLSQPAGLFCEISQQIIGIGCFISITVYTGNNLSHTVIVVRSTLYFSFCSRLDICKAIRQIIGIGRTSSFSVYKTDKIAVAVIGKAYDASQRICYRSQPVVMVIRVWRSAAISISNSCQTIYGIIAVLHSYAQCVNLSNKVSAAIIIIKGFMFPVHSGWDKISYLIVCISLRSSSCMTSRFRLS